MSSWNFPILFTLADMTHAHSLYTYQHCQYTNNAYQTGKMGEIQSSHWTVMQMSRSGFSVLTVTGYLMDAGSLLFFLRDNPTYPGDPASSLHYMWHLGVTGGNSLVFPVGVLFKVNCFKGSCKHKFKVLSHAGKVRTWFQPSSQRAQRCTI